ncbi:hypothetical protein DVH24_025934 [Malus domestica]|uniref:Uncharacterized protein n=1 Tax=Malus domestica TaxID=3750 RepID=A0A498KGJ2_MALDO|nr:hypothetical protein DVH24_025934 [Malus domestica]
MMKPPTRGLLLWVSLAEKGFYGFKPTVCALCCWKTYDILQCPEREYFPEFLQKHINMRNNSKRHWNNPYSEFYTPSLKKYIYFMWACNLQYFEQPDVPQELPVEDKISILLEANELYIERTNQGFQIQALNCENIYDDHEEIGAETEEPPASYSRPRAETPLLIVKLFPQNLPPPKSMCQTQPVKMLQRNTLRLRLEANQP